MWNSEGPFLRNEALVRIFSSREQWSCSHSEVDGRIFLEPAEDVLDVLRHRVQPAQMAGVELHDRSVILLRLRGPGRLVRVQGFLGYACMRLRASTREVSLHVPARLGATVNEACSRPRPRASCSQASPTR